jgi:hypothetical protein
MKQETAEISDCVTVIVFKDNYAARTFRVPLKWINQLGILSGILVFITLASLVFAIKFYKTVVNMNPERVLELKREIAELKDAQKSYTQNSVILDTTQKSSHSSVTKSVLTPLFPEIKISTNNDYTLGPMTANWVSRRLRVQFKIDSHLQNVEDQKPGKLFVFAHGSEIIMSLPLGSMSGKDSVIAFEKGADYLPAKKNYSFDFLPNSPGVLKQIEVFLFSTQGELLASAQTPVPPVQAAQPVQVKPPLTQEVPSL